MSRNKPFASQRPAPPFANDPTGFFAGVLKDNECSGISSLLPASTVLQSDVAVKAMLLEGQIRWTPTTARWKGSNIIVSLSDSNFLLDLESGGPVQDGTLNVVAAKNQFNNGYPSYGDTIKILAGVTWHDFTIEQINGLHDDNEPGLTLALLKDQNADGN